MGYVAVCPNMNKYVSQKKFKFIHKEKGLTKPTWQSKSMRWWNGGENVIDHQIMMRVNSTVYLQNLR